MPQLVLVALAVVSAAVMPLPKGVKAVDGSLVTATGAQLYVFKHDTMVGMSHCSGDCAKDWPPLIAPAAAKPVKDWTRIDRGDGVQQWALQDHPLYTARKTGAELKQALEGGLWLPARVGPPRP